MRSVHSFRYTEDEIATTLLQTKLCIPPPRPELAPRPRLIERLNEGIRSDRKLTLISAPTGFGKTTLLSEWINPSPAPNTQFPRFAWISLDEGDTDFAFFLTHLIAALQRVEPGLGETLLAVFQSSTNQAVRFMLERLPHQLHLVIVTRRDSPFPLALLRARGQMT